MSDDVTNTDNDEVNISPRSSHNKSFTSDDFNFNDRLSDVKSEDRTVFFNDNVVSDCVIVVDDVIHVNVHQFYPDIDVRSKGANSKDIGGDDDTFGVPHSHVRNDENTQPADERMDKHTNEQTALVDALCLEAGDAKHHVEYFDNEVLVAVDNLKSVIELTHGDVSNENGTDGDKRSFILRGVRRVGGPTLENLNNNARGEGADESDKKLDDTGEITSDDTNVSNERLKGDVDSDNDEIKSKVLSRKLQKDPMYVCKKEGDWPDGRLSRVGSNLCSDLASIKETADEGNMGFGDENNSSGVVKYSSTIGLESRFSLVKVIVEQPSTTSSITDNFPPSDIYTGDNFTMSDIIQFKVFQLFHQAMDSKREHDHVRTVALLRKAMYLKPNVVQHYKEMANCLLQMCDIKGSILYLKRACFLDPSRTDLFDKLAFIFYFQGQMLFDQHLFEQSLESFTQATEIKPHNLEYHTRGLACLAALGRHSECLSLITHQLENQQKDNADLHVMRARLHQLYGNLTLVYYDVKDALRINPKHAEALLILSRQEILAEQCKRQGMRMMINHKYPEALQKFTAAIDINPSVDTFHLLRGVLHRKMANFNSAIDDFLLALDKDGHDEESEMYANAQRQLLLTYNDFAVECFRKGYRDEAVVLLNKAIKGEKREKGLYMNRGDCFFPQDLNFALQDYCQAFELDPYDPDIRSRISIVYGELGVLASHENNFTEAESRYGQAIQFNPRICQHHISRARTRYMLKDTQGARHDLIIALLINPAAEDLLSIHVRLFPGKSIGEVLTSKLVENVRSEFDQLMSAAPLSSIPPKKKPMHSVSQIQLKVSGILHEFNWESAAKTHAKRTKTMRTTSFKTFSEIPKSKLLVPSPSHTMMSSTCLSNATSMSHCESLTEGPPEDDKHIIHDLELSASVEPCVRTIDDLQSVRHDKREITNEIHRLLKDPLDLSHQAPRMIQLGSQFSLAKLPPINIMTTITKWKNKSITNENTFSMSTITK